MPVIKQKRVVALSRYRLLFWFSLLSMNVLVVCLLTLFIPTTLPKRNMRKDAIPFMEMSENNTTDIVTGNMNGHDDGQVNVLILRPDDISIPTSRYCKWVYLNQKDFGPDNHQILTAYSILHATFVSFQPVLVVSLGDFHIWEKLGVTSMPYNFQRLWVHYDSLDTFPDDAILTDLFLARQERTKHEPPLISVFTTTYKSGTRLERAYQSLLAQTHDYWEWILWDDSPAEDKCATFETLKAMAARDMRLQVYKAPQQSGSIGQMKFRAASLASGEWLVELDHDDRLGSQLFEWIKEISQRRPGTKFIYSDHVELDEENDEPFTYGQYYGFYHGSYVRRHLRPHENAPLKPHYISRAPWATPLTLSHLAGLPNHVRIWNMSFYQAIGRHNLDLTVADDYELLLKTYVNVKPGEIVCIASPSYFQYRSRGGNNFSIKRNALIQHLVWHLHKKWQKGLSVRYKELGWQDSGYKEPSHGIWEKEVEDTGPRLEHYFVPEDQDARNPCVSIIITTYKGTSSLERILQSVVEQTYTNWHVYIIGYGCPILDNFATQNISALFPQSLQKINWYNLRGNYSDEGLTAQRYALKMLVKTQMVICLNSPQKMITWRRNQKYLQFLVEGLKNEDRVFDCDKKLKKIAY